MNYPRHPVSFVIGQTSGILIGCYLFFDTKILSSCPILKQAKQQARFRIHGSGCPLFSLHLKCLGNERVHTDR